MERVLTGIEQVLIVFPDSNLRRSPNLEEVSVPKLHEFYWGVDRLRHLEERLRTLPAVERSEYIGQPLSFGKTYELKFLHNPMPVAAGCGQNNSDGCVLLRAARHTASLSHGDAQTKRI